MAGLMTFSMMRWYSFAVVASERCSARYSESHGDPAWAARRDDPGDFAGPGVGSSCEPTGRGPSLSHELRDVDVKHLVLVQLDDPIDQDLAEFFTSRRLG